MGHFLLDADTADNKSDSNHVDGTPLWVYIVVIVIVALIIAFSIAAIIVYRNKKKADKKSEMMLFQRA